MANIYTQIRMHIIFSTRRRHPFTKEENREEIQRCMSGITASLHQKLLATYCIPDHGLLLGGLGVTPLPPSKILPFAHPLFLYLKI